MTEETEEKTKWLQGFWGEVLKSGAVSAVSQALISKGR
jgi:hypothetical protein